MRARALPILLSWRAPRPPAPRVPAAWPPTPCRAAPPPLPPQGPTVGPDGKAVAPADAPPAVRAAIEAGNAIVGRPYRLGGGHARFEDHAHDCSGAISCALRGAGLPTRPLDSGSLTSWRPRGRRAWITVSTNAGHAVAVVAGLRLDTGAAGDPSGPKSPRRCPALRSTRGFRARRCPGL